MKVQAAAISLQDTPMVVVLVGMDLIENPSEAGLVIDGLQPHFGNAPVVLMAQTENGSPRYYGEEPVIQLLRGVPLEKMPWREYNVG